MVEISHTRRLRSLRDYVEKKIHAMDLKNATARYLNQIIEPVRKHFEGREPNFGETISN